MFESNSDEEVPVKKHAALLKSAAAVYGRKFQRIHPPDRNEPSFEVSEFHLFDKRKKKEKIAKTLAGSLDKVGKHAHISQKYKVQTFSKALPAPLERPEAEKIKRTVAYDNAKNVLNRWEPIVNTNKVSEDLNFPLNTPYFRMASTKSFLANLKPQTDLELEVDKILTGVSNDTKEKEDYTSKKTCFLNRKEIIDQRKEQARIRAQQSYREAKARCQNKIKSKKYHRILRRENTSKQIQEFEKLQKNDPETALKKLEELEKTRAEERASLRHRSTGQWARNKAVLAKYDKEACQQLQEQLRMSKNLTEKLNLANSSGDEDIEDNYQETEDNPWMKSPSNEYEEFSNQYCKYWNEQKLSKTKCMEVLDETESFRKGKETECSNLPRSCDCHQAHTSEDSKSISNSVVKYGFIVTEMGKDSGRSLNCKNGTNPFNIYWKCSVIGNHSKKKSTKFSDTDDVDDLFEDMENLVKKKFQKKISYLKRNNREENPKKRKKKNVEKNGEIEKSDSQVKDDLSLQQTITEETIGDLGKEDSYGCSDIMFQLNGKYRKPGAVLSNGKTDILEINPTNFILMSEKQLCTKVPDIINEEDDEYVAAREKIMTISEAFTDDDVVAEFCQEKEAIAENDRPKDIDLTLPGWGEWAGKGLPEVTKKKKRFIIPIPKIIVGKDEKKDSVIINEESDYKARRHQVSELPYPYVAVESFESNICAPLGSTWVPETAHRKLTAPRITTLIGAVIEPLSEEALYDHSEVKKNLDEKEIRVLQKT